MKKDEKFCPCCLAVKPLDDFHKNVRAKSGRSSYCKKCVAKSQKRSQAQGKPTRGTYDNPTPTVAERKCPRCEIVKVADEFPRNRSTRTGLAAYCKKCVREKKQ